MRSSTKKNGNTSTSELDKWRAEYARAILAINKKGNKPTEALLARELGVPRLCVRSFLVQNPSFAAQIEPEREVVALRREPVS